MYIQQQQNIITTYSEHLINTFSGKDSRMIFAKRPGTGQHVNTTIISTDPDGIFN